AVDAHAAVDQGLEQQGRSRVALFNKGAAKGADAVHLTPSCPPKEPLAGRLIGKVARGFALLQVILRQVEIVETACRARRQQEGLRLSGPDAEALQGVFQAFYGTIAIQSISGVAEMEPGNELRPYPDPRDDEQPQHHGENGEALRAG